MKILTGGTHAADREFLLKHDLIRKTGTHFSGSCCLPDHVRQQAEETRALDRAREFTLLLGGDGGYAARHDPPALRDVKHQQLGILVIHLQRIRTPERGRLPAADKRTAWTFFRHHAQPSTRTP